MGLKIFLLLVMVPALEVYLLIKIGSWLGPWITFGLILFTGALGAKLAHSQGLQIVLSIQNEFKNGRIPAEQLINGLCVLIAGVVLITPGFITDLIGFSLLVPAFRNVFQKRVLKLIWNNFNIYSQNPDGSTTNNPHQNPGEIKTNWHVDS